ncbi:uncharacterized protein LOC113771040 [Coffea eugenioides]|uniref:uncharacterized protein LOC113771022 n=1 Tax=Coffea eugenioides TaxID=49369 RepID=UPI000F60BDAF|nr:uncharacterized protein LOC113771022 [Coffea eugenioides]XP_027171469.1 uncharacterized protein LOC113771040 [Coffea eugenioides]
MLISDNRRRGSEFGLGDHVFLKVAFSKGLMRFDIKGKLSPSYVGPFEILDRVGEVACRLALPLLLVGVHNNVFHVSILRKYVHDPSHMIEYAPHQLSKELSYEEYSVKIVDTKDQMLRYRTIPCVKNFWCDPQSVLAVFVAHHHPLQADAAPVSVPRLGALLHLLLNQIHHDFLRA